MTLKGEAKFKGKPKCGLKNDIRNLVNFHASSKKSKNLHFDGLLLSKAFTVLDEKVQKSYVSWRWRVIQSLTKSWVLVPKMTWEIEWILMWAVASLKICNLMLILSKVHCLWAKKSTEELCVIKLENDCKIWKITCALKRTSEIWQILTQHDLSFNDLLSTKVYNGWAKKLQRTHLPWHWRVMQYLKVS